mgnify:CR=1 FL=1
MRFRALVNLDGQPLSRVPSPIRRSQPPLLGKAINVALFTPLFRARDKFKCTPLSRAKFGNLQFISARERGWETVIPSNAH